MFSLDALSIKSFRVPQLIINVTEMSKVRCVYDVFEQTTHTPQVLVRHYDASPSNIVLIHE